MFIIELGASEAGPIDEDGKPTKIWHSSGFYNLYSLYGPIIVQKKEEAFKFPERGMAQNVVNGDERLTASRIIDA